MDVSWARGTSAGLVRGGILAGILAPLLYLYVKRRVDGRDVLGAEITDPVIFVANHNSHLDTPTILRAIPPEWRKRTAVAAAADYFYKSRWRAWSAALVFNTVPHGPDRRRPQQRRERSRARADRGRVEPADLPRGHALS